MKNLAELAQKNRENQKKAKSRKVTLIVVSAVILITMVIVTIVALLVFKRNVPDPVYYTPDPNTTAEPASTTVNTTAEETVLYLRSGNYLAGTDIPSGTYDLEVIEGNGYVYSDNYGFGSISESMGLYDSSYHSSFRNMILEDGQTLSINGPTLMLRSVDASKDPLPGREPWSEEGYTLISGNYKVGRDFPEGIYDIFLDEGEGYFSSSNSYDGGCSNSFGTESDWDIQVFYHCDLPEGTEISISSLQVSIYPSGLVPVDYYTPIEP